MAGQARSAVRIPVLVFADWDADGATSAAMIYYAQYYRKLYPLQGRQDVALQPTGPRGLAESLEEFMSQHGCPKALVVLDIPLTDSVLQALKRFAVDCKDARIIYIDHHFSTLYMAKQLYKLSEEVYLGHKPTAILTYNLLRSLGIQRLTPRLQAFVNAVGILERSRRPASEAESRIVKLAASVSKASTVLRDAELWRRLVRWLASPLPQDLPIDREAVEKALKVAEESDKELMDKARELAFSARRVGYLKFVDARRVWGGRRGASALASKLYKILRQPVAMLVEREDGVRLLIVRAKGGGAYRVAVGLLREGLAENIGGHGGLAVVRLRDNVDISELLDKLRRLSLKL